MNQQSKNDHQHDGRLLNVSIFRVISMLMIVLFHCMCYCSDYWQEYPCPAPDAVLRVVASFVVSLALPFFFFASGFLYAFIYQDKNGYRNWKAFLVNKVKRLILPAISWTVICLLLLPFRYSVRELLAGIMHLWFLPTLFFIFILARLLSPWLMARRKPLVDVVLLCGLVMMAYLIFVAYTWSGVDDGFLFGRIMTSVGYFLAGMMMYKLRLSFSQKPLELIALILLLGWHAVNLNVQMYALQTLVDNYVIIAISVLALDLLSSVKPKQNFVVSPVLNSMDKNGLGIYLVHQVLIMALFQYTQFEESFLTFHPHIGTAVLFLLVLPLSWGLTELKRKAKLEPYL